MYFIFYEQHDDEYHADCVFSFIYFFIFKNFEEILCHLDREGMKRLALDGFCCCEKNISAKNEYKKV